MAYKPCDCHGARFRGKAAYSYPCMLHDGEANRKRVRLCPTGSANLQMGLGRGFLDLDGSAALSGQRADRCVVCELPVVDDQGVLLFVTTYLPGQDRQDWAGVACFAHEADAARMLSLAA